MRHGEQWKQIHQVTLKPEQTPSVVDELSLSQSESAAPSTGESHVSRRRNRAMFWAIGLVSMIGAAGGFLWVKGRPMSARRTQVETPVAVHTGFSANRDGSAWKLTWDTTAVEAMKPTAGILSIQDGTGQQDLALSRADLSSGTIYYSPKSSELAFQLQVQKDGVALAEERVRVLDGIRPIPKPPDQAQKADFRSSRFSGSDARPSQAAAVIAGPPAQAVGTGDDTSGTPRRKMAARNFLPPSSGMRPPQSLPVLSAAEPPIATLAIPLPLSPDISSSFVASPAPPSPVPATASTEAQPLQNVPVSAKASATAAAPPSSYVGPKPTRQVQPQLPPGLGPGPGQVEVKVSINAKGRVTKIGLISSTTNPLLMIEARKAAGLWEFEPERLNGQPVPSEMNVLFRFQ
jgi:TonB family protein